MAITPEKEQRIKDGLAQQVENLQRENVKRKFLNQRDVISGMPLDRGRIAQKMNEVKSRIVKQIKKNGDFYQPPQKGAKRG